jgi:hypothetical protein
MKSKKLNVRREKLETLFTSYVSRLTEDSYGSN